MAQQGKRSFELGIHMEFTAGQERQTHNHLTELESEKFGIRSDAKYQRRLQVRLKV